MRMKFFSSLFPSPRGCDGRRMSHMDISPLSLKPSASRNEHQIKLESLHLKIVQSLVSCSGLWLHLNSIHHAPAISLSSYILLVCCHILGQTIFSLAKCAVTIGVLLPRDPYFATTASIVWGVLAHLLRARGSLCPRFTSYDINQINSSENWELINNAATLKAQTASGESRRDCRCHLSDV